ncbi:MAG: hypothetical protein AAGF95_06480 [Chloroflexota bacterium]
MAEFRVRIRRYCTVYPTSGLFALVVMVALAIERRAEAAILARSPTELIES